MAKKTKTRQITLINESGSFKTLFKKFAGEKKSYDFEGLSALRNLLSNEKARILNVIKLKNPTSIYNLSKILERDFKSVKNWKKGKIKTSYRRRFYKCRDFHLTTDFQSTFYISWKCRSNIASSPN